MGREGYLLLANEMMKRSGAKSVLVRYWENDTEHEFELRERSRDEEVGQRRKVQ